MNKKEIFEFFDQKISKKAIQNRDGEWVVIGKTCIVAVEPGGMIDIWICNPDRPELGLGTGAVRNRLELLKKYKNKILQKLNGEGWCKTKDKAAVLENIKLLGIKKKKTCSPEKMEQLRERRRAIKCH